VTALTAAQPADISFDDHRTRTTVWHVIRSEWTKIWSVRSTFWTLLSLVVVTVGLSTLFAWGASSNLGAMSPQNRANLDVTSQAMGGLLLGQLAIAVLGALVICSEYSTGGIKATLTAVPNRLRVLLAKGLVFAVIALVVGLITAFGAFYVSMIFWSHHGLAAHLGDPGVLRAVIGGGLYVLASGMFGFTIGVLIRHSGGAIATVVGLLFVAPLLTNALPGDWGSTINKYFTANAGQHITDVVHPHGVLMPWAGYLTITVEWVVPLIVGAWLMRRRDA
jgi:ABC-type transport system involved in multi-copper enzyme maturation permease subunit